MGYLVHLLKKKTPLNQLIRRHICAGEGHTTNVFEETKRIKNGL